ncbi:MAG: YicC family protein [Candidatus Marinimicrobia bacterium]|nr:YicC family protein [Candidatus Neomarinimicrobiota bacterium]MCF7839173.1 YicC family protein [Candidatus Neomarinimicrobiota bacterium]
MSMTGFGKAEVKHAGIDLTIEVRSVNSRFLEMNFRQPRMLAEFEDLARPIIQSRIPRGKLQISMNLPNEGTLNAIPVLNKDLAQAYVEIGHAARELTGNGSELNIAELLQLPDVIQFEPKISNKDAFFKDCIDGLQRALDNLDQMRSVEGQHLEEAMSRQLDTLEQLLGEIENGCESRAAEAIEKLRTKIQSNLGDIDADERRLEQELVIWSDKLDISEELVRFTTHLQHFRHIMQSDANAGRRLNFLLQEMNREANTIGSKSYSSGIAHAVVELKSEVEKIREQIQNIQ